MKFFSDDSNRGTLEVETPQVDRETIMRNVAAYARMFTEHQQYSIPNQLDVIREYAARHRWSLTKIYADEGRSGLNIEGRQALSQMISDVLTKSDFGRSLALAGAAGIGTDDSRVHHRTRR